MVWLVQNWIRLTATHHFASTHLYTCTITCLWLIVLTPHPDEGLSSWNVDVISFTDLIHFHIKPGCVKTVLHLITLYKYMCTVSREPQSSTLNLSIYDNYMIWVMRDHWKREWWSKRAWQVCSTGDTMASPIPAYIHYSLLLTPEYPWTTHCWHRNRFSGHSSIRYKNTTITVDINNKKRRNGVGSC